MKTVQQIGAVLAGFLTVAVLSIATDTVLEKTGIFPPPSDQGLFITWMLLLAFAYRSLYAVAGGYVCAALSAENKKRQVTILGILGTAGGIAGVVYGWNMSDHWYPIALAVTAFPLTWLGGSLKQQRS
jgi:hypothetical protein